MACSGLNVKVPQDHEAVVLLGLNVLVPQQGRGCGVAWELKHFSSPATGRGCGIAWELKHFSSPARARLWYCLGLNV